MILLATGMQKSATGLSFNILNDLIAASPGGNDVRMLKKTFHLEKLLRHHNCNIGKLTPDKLHHLKKIERNEGSFVVKSHEKFSDKLILDLKNRKFSVIYSYRDPRDVAVSAYEAGEKLRRSDGFRLRGFSKLLTIEMSILWVYLKLIPVYNFYNNLKNAYLFKYEDFIYNRKKILEEILKYLSIEPEPDILKKIIEKDIRSAKTHFNKGLAGRHRSVMTESQLVLSNKIFRNTLRNMGYED